MNIIFTKIKSLGGIGITEDNNCIVLFHTNKGVLSYDTNEGIFQLNDITISENDYELENAYKAVIKALSYTLRMNLKLPK